MKCGRCCVCHCVVLILLLAFVCRPNFAAETAFEKSLFQKTQRSNARGERARENSFPSFGELVLLWITPQRRQSPVPIDADSMHDVRVRLRS